MATLPVPIETPCGTKTVKVPVPGAIPTLEDLPDFLKLLAAYKFPPSLPIPIPPCSVVEHTGSAPEPPEDSEP